MAVTPTYPGVYVQEVPSGVRAIAGVSTSIGMFIGRAADGPLNVPVRCLNYTKFQTVFSDQYANSDLARAVRLFFDNGGTDCYVMRIAGGTIAQAKIELRTEGTPTSALAPRDGEGSGRQGQQDPRRRYVQRPRARGRVQPGGLQLGDGLGRRAHANRGRALAAALDRPELRALARSRRRGLPLVVVKARARGAGTGSLGPGGRLPAGAGEWGQNASHRHAGADRGRPAATIRNKFQISVDGRPFKEITLENIDFTAPPLDALNVANIVNALPAAIKQEINTQLTGGAVDVDFVVGPTANPPTPEARPAADLLHRRGREDRAGRRSAGGSRQCAYARSGSGRNRDLALLGGAARALRRGVQGHQHRRARAAPAGRVQQDPDRRHRRGPRHESPTLATPASKAMFQDKLPNSPNGNNDGVREKLGIIADAIRAKAQSDPAFAWRPEIWGSRLALLPRGGLGQPPGLREHPRRSGHRHRRELPAERSLLHARPRRDRELPGQQHQGGPGGKPLLTQYRQAFGVIDREVDLFNLLVLPLRRGPRTPTGARLVGPASVFCQEQRAFLLIDPPPAWRDEADATSPTTGVNSLQGRTGQGLQRALLPAPHDRGERQPGRGRPERRDRRPDGPHRRHARRLEGAGGHGGRPARRRRARVPVLGRARTA